MARIAVVILTLVLPLLKARALPSATEGKVTDVKVTVLSDMIAGRNTVGEWGFAAFVEVTSERAGVVQKKHILFDTGGKPQTVIDNSLIERDSSKDLKVDFSRFTNNEIEVVLSHNHNDHTTGLIPLIRKFPKAFGKIHVGQHMFHPRRRCADLDAQKRCHEIEEGEFNYMIQVLAEYRNIVGPEAAAENIVVHQDFGRLDSHFPGVFVTGHIPRVTNEDNNAGNNYLLYKSDDDYTYDDIPEELSLVIKTESGLVVITGCAHAGVINTLRHATKQLGEERVEALMGGFHLLALTKDQVHWTGDELSKYQVQHFLGSHCTGLERLVELRSRIPSLTKNTALFGTVGTIYELGKGFMTTRPSIANPIPHSH